MTGSVEKWLVFEEAGEFSDISWEVSYGADEAGAVEGVDAIEAMEAMEAMDAIEAMEAMEAMDAMELAEENPFSWKSSGGTN